MESTFGFREKGQPQAVSGWSGLFLGVALFAMFAGVLPAVIVQAQAEEDPCQTGPDLYRAAMFDEARTALRACLEHVCWVTEGFEK